MCAQKLTNSQLNLPHGTKQKTVMKKLKTKNEMLRRNGPVIKAVEKNGVTPEAQRESTLRKICERGR